MGHQNVRALHVAGVTTLAETDATGKTVGKMMHQDHGLEDRGVSTVGKQADLILLDGNLFENISNTQRVFKIWLGGVWFWKRESSTLRTLV